LLRAYFDESGLHENAGVTGVAGFIGTADEWTNLENEWHSELRRFASDTGRDIKGFHAYDCENGEDFWFGIDRSIRESYYRRLAFAVSKYKGLRGVAIAVEIREWEKRASLQFKERYLSPYQLCAEHCFRQVASYSRNRASGSDVALVFAKHPKYSGHIREVFSYYMGNKLWANIKSLTFASPKDSYPLQCADMISYESYRYWEEIRKGHFSTMVDRDGWRILSDAGHFEFSACYGGLGLMNAVRRFHSVEGLPDPYPSGRVSEP
jgi:hypothetical protein